MFPSDDCSAASYLWSLTDATGRTSTLQMTRLAVVVVALVSTLSNAQRPTEGASFDPTLPSPSRPSIVGASNCIGPDIWDVAVRGGDPGNEYELYGVNFSTGLAGLTG